MREEQTALMVMQLRRYEPADALKIGRVVDVRSADGTRLHAEV
ncbi:MAG: hypothetical protein QOK12_1033, partial [Mycobacterium sp.]|nr:hypothetical protein [Mycobacterium sp.]